MSRSEELEYMFSGNGYQPPTEDCFNTEKKVCFHTGLPSTEILLTLFDHISTGITQRSQTLSKFQEFIMVLIKLRLNIPSPSISINSVQDIFLMVDCNRFLFVVTHLLARQKSAMETNANVFPVSIWQKSDCDHSLLWSFYWSTNKPSSTSTNFFLPINTTIQLKYWLGLHHKEQFPIYLKHRKVEPQTNIWMKIVACWSN